MPEHEEQVRAKVSGLWSYCAIEGARAELDRKVERIGRDPEDLGWLLVLWADGYIPSLRDVWAFSIAWHELGEAPERVQHWCGRGDRFPAKTLGLGVIPCE